MLGAESRPPGLGVLDDDVAAAEATTTPADVLALCQELVRGCPGSSSTTLAVAAMSALTAMPDPLVSESMPRPLLRPAQRGTGTVRSSRPARRQQLFREFLRV